MRGAVVRGLARCYPWEVDASTELTDALSFIESELHPETVVRAGYGAGMVSLLLLVPLSMLPVPLPVTAVFVLAVAWSVIEVFHSLPVLLAAFRRTRALGDAPNLVGRAVLRMQIQPATETAVRFAAETGRGPLAESLAAHIDRSMGTPETGLIAFAEEWADEFPAIRRSAHLLATAQDAPEGERARTLDRALAAVLDGTRDEMSRFTAAIRGPTTALYAFGVMLPLALVALVPAATIAGYPVSIWVFVILYNLMLPVGLVAASLWLLVRRPVAFPPPDVDRGHPDVTGRLSLRLLAGVVAGGAAYAVTLRFGPPALAGVGGVGVGIGAALLAVFHPVVVVRNYVRDVEEHLVDALYIIGRQVAEGEAVESAVEVAGDRVPAETGSVFREAAGLQRRLHIGVEEAFLGEYGALVDVPSDRAHGTASLLAIASSEGQPAGRAIVSMADHLEELREVERETKRTLREVTGTLDNTATFFGPIVAGATVGLADIIAERGIEATGQAALPTDELGLVVGGFVVTLCFILVPLSVSLRNGLDRALLSYSIGRSLVLAVPLYVATVGVIGILG